MTDTVSFDGLGISFNVPYDGTAFSIGRFTVKWYAVMILIGMVLAVIYAFRMIKRYHINEDKFLNAVIGGIIGGIIGARLYYVAFSWDSYASDPVSILYIWKGGLAIYGGIIGAVLVGGIIAKIGKLCIRDVFDVTFMGFLLGQGIGRWGNFFNREAFGINTTLPWGMTSENIKIELAHMQASGMDVDPALPVHPTFLYESLWCLLGFVLLHFLVAKRRKFKGQVIVSYGIWYGVGRFFIEGLRTDSLMAGSLRVSQVLSLVIVAVSIVLYVIGLVKSKNNPIVYENADIGDETASENEEISAETQESDAAEEASESSESDNIAEESAEDTETQSETETTEEE